MKVFGVGFIKTGTTTLGAALQRLGYNHCGGSWKVANRLVGPYLNGNMKAFDGLVNKHDSFEDFPFCAPGMAQKLDKRYPDSKFILTTREPESWFNSLTTYFDLSESVSLLKVSKRNNGLPLGRFPGMICGMMATFGTLDVATNKEHYLETYKKYNQDVIDYFRDKPNKLLVVSWMEGHGWKELCGFLGKPAPTTRFPIANRNPRNGQHNEK